MTSADRPRSFLLALWLCLTMVLAHSVLPVGSPLAPRPGSAFNIATTDVALTPSRRQDQGKSDQLSASKRSADQAAGGDDLATAPPASAAYLPPRREAAAPGFVRTDAPARPLVVPGARPRAPPLA